NFSNFGKRGVLMGKNYDLPDYLDVQQIKAEHKDEAIAKIKNLCLEQSFAVLASRGKESAYTSLISFVVNEDFQEIIFASPTDTKKIDFIKKNKEVSLLIDNRDSNPNSINDILAVTVMGKAYIVNEKAGKYQEALGKKHQYLADFIKAPTTVIVRIKIDYYHYVSRFQEVIEWSPIDK
ncbi:MAG: pyridoxamine 5'-phosphate oxidase family protein, partial [Atopostipes suicloacalis]|nr:pyridoxamine 5'-phosphate oxidase family protein [Atopostipes suicloacalis]